MHVGNGTGNRRAIDVDIKYVEKDANASLVRTKLADQDDSAVGGRHKNVGRRVWTVRVAEEVQAKSG